MGAGINWICFEIKQLVFDLSGKYNTQVIYQSDLKQTPPRLLQRFTMSCVLAFQQIMTPSVPPKQ